MAISGIGAHTSINSVQPGSVTVDAHAQAKPNPAQKTAAAPNVQAQQQASQHAALHQKVAAPVASAEPNKGQARQAKSAPEQSKKLSGNLSGALTLNTLDSKKKSGNTTESAEPESAVQAAAPKKSKAPSEALSEKKGKTALTTSTADVGNKEAAPDNSSKATKKVQF